MERKKRGFALLSPERRREIAAKGGASVPEDKRSFYKDRALAASAGKKGGEACIRNYRNDKSVLPEH